MPRPLTYLKTQVLGLRMRCPSAEAPPAKRQRTQPSGADLPAAFAGGGPGEGSLGDLQQHRNDCPFEPVTCPYAFGAAGCQERPWQEQLQQHMADFMAQHAKSSIRALRDEETYSTKLRQFFKDLEKEHAKLRQEHSDLEEEVTELRQENTQTCQENADLEVAQRYRQNAKLDLPLGTLKREHISFYFEVLLGLAVAMYLCSISFDALKLFVVHALFVIGGCSACLVGSLAMSWLVYAYFIIMFASFQGVLDFGEQLVASNRLGILLSQISGILLLLFAPWLLLFALLQFGFGCEVKRQMPVGERLRPNVFFNYCWLWAVLHSVLVFCVEGYSWWCGT